MHKDFLFRQKEQTERRVARVQGRRCVLEEVGVEDNKVNGVWFDEAPVEFEPEDIIFLINRSIEIVKTMRKRPSVVLMKRSVYVKIKKRIELAHARGLYRRWQKFKRYMFWRQFMFWLDRKE